jgi:hypothetical protein
MPVSDISTTPPLTVQQLADHHAIEQCLVVHARGIDRADLGLLQSAYHEGATVDYGFFNGAAAEMAAMLIAAQRTAPVSLHRPSNVWIELDGNSARAESYVLAYFESSQAGGNVQSLACGRYLDRLEQRDGQWKLTHRTYVLDWNSHHPSTAAIPDTSFASDHFLPLGAHGPRDPGNIFLTVLRAGAGPQLRETAAMPATTATAITLDTLQSRHAVQQLLLTYCRAVDRLDSELLASIFHPDAGVITGHFNGSGSDFARDITAWCRANTRRTFHTVSNQWFDIQGDSAVAESYVIAVQTAPDAEGNDRDMLVGGRYLDKFERRAGVWKIAQHTFVLDWNISQPTTAIFSEGMYAQMLQGGHKPNDPLYSF